MSLKMTPKRVAAQPPLQEARTPLALGWSLPSKPQAPKPKHPRAPRPGACRVLWTPGRWREIGWRPPRRPPPKRVAARPPVQEAHTPLARCWHLAGRLQRASLAHRGANLARGWGTLPPDGSRANRPPPPQHVLRAVRMQTRACRVLWTLGRRREIDWRPPRRPPPKRVAARPPVQEARTPLARCW